MRYGAKRVISLLTALVMVSSFVVVPVSAVTSPTVTLSSGQTQTKYIFANSEYNSLEKMTELAEPIKGTYNGEDVELIPKWEKPEKLFNGFQGSREGHYGANKFTATTFTVKGTGEDITPSGVEVTLNVWVIGVYAKLEVDKTPIIMTKSEALAVGIDNEFASVLDLPTEASVTYESAKFSDHPDWNTAAGELDTSNDLKNYNITGWYMFGYYDEAKNPLRITPETLRNLAGEVGVSKDKQEVTLFPHYSDEPKWATVDSGDANIILKITPDPTVTVMMPEREYKCYSEGEQVPGATATAKIGEEEMENATFSFMYEGIDGTTYSNNTPPTDAGKYKVTATLTTPGYSGEGSAEFTISKAANGTTNANILVPAGDTQRFSISALKLPVGMAKGAKIKKASPITGGSVLDSVTADKTSFTLKTKQAEEKESQSFNLVLTSDNYDTLTVNVTATVDNSPVTLPKITVKEPYVFEYGTPLSEIVEIIETGTGFDLQDPTEVYNVGEYSRIYVESTKNGVLKEVPVTFTIVPATIQSFDNESSAYVQYGYWTTIYANHKKNIENNLTKLFPKTYTGFYANGEKITLNAEWSLDDGSAPYNPRGYEDNVWYEYTAHLTPVPPEGTTGEVFARNFNISDAPKGHIRVMPANAYQTIDSESKVVEKEEVGQWTDDDWETKLSLPQTADVTYVHAPEKISSAYMLAEESTDTTGILAEESTAAAYIAAGAPPAIAYKLAREAVNDSDELEETEETTGTYEINGWKMEDDTNLTLQRIRDEGVSEIRLTPIYKETPAWATWEDFLPTFTLVITEGDVPTDINSVTVTKPKDIIYGVEVDKPIVEGIGEDDVTFKYEGMYGTNYYDTNKPTNAGDYRVVATWKENPSVRWTSEVFTIAPKEVKIIGIKCKTGGREYDGTTNANSVLDVENAKVLDDEKTIPGVTVSAASGYFADDVIGEKNQDGTGKNVGTNKTVVVIDATLIGEGAGNYKFVPFRETEDGQEATTTTRCDITEKSLTINDSGLTVTKAQSEGSWKLEGKLKLEGVINSEIRLDTSGMTVEESEETDVGTGKTVQLTGIKLVDKNNNKGNYSLPNNLKEDTDTYTYTFTRAEITKKPRPKLNTHFTVDIPAASTYNGEARVATYQAKSGVTGLGTATVTYAKRLTDGIYDTPVTEKPLNAGIYKVLVSFAEGSEFDAAQGQNAVTAGSLIINKAAEAGESTAEITVPSVATKTIYLRDLGLSDAVVQGAKIKVAPSVDGSEILESVTGAVGRDFFTLKTKSVDESQTGVFTVTLVSDNYETVKVTIKVTVDAGALNITPPKVKLNPGPFVGDTPLKDILALEGGSVTLKGEAISGSFSLKEPDKICTPGTYTNHPFEVVFKSDDKQHTGTVTVRASFTVEESSDDYISKLDKVYFTIYANSVNNKSADALKAFVQKKKPDHKVDGGKEAITWSTASENVKFESKGYKDNVWYTYTASVSNGEELKAGVRVIPVNATPDIKEKTLTADEIRELTSLDDLPKVTPVSYAPAENVENPTENFTETTGTWKITSWKMDGRDLTLEALKARVSGAGSEDVKVTLIPVYGNVPAWATFTGGSDDSNGGGGNGGGGSIGGGGGGGVPTNPGNTTNPDGSKTTVETKEDGTVITTTVDAQGNETRTEKKPDGSILSTVHHKNGCNGTIETDTAGKTIAVVDVPSAVASGAAGGGSAVPLPVVDIRADKDIDKAPAMVVNTAGVNGVKVRIPVENMSPTVVAVEIKSDGTPVVIKKTIPDKDGILVRLNDGEVIRFLDNSKPFADTKGHWAADAVGFVSARELFNGTSPDTFSPNAKMTRGMLVTVLARYEDVDTQGGSTWYEKGAAWAKANGLSDGTNLNGNITREQLATIMYRYADFQGKLNSTDEGLHGYTDAGRVSSWAADAMAWAVGVGLIQGTTPTTLDPQGSATRGQVATIIMRYAEMFGL